MNEKLPDLRHDETPPEGVQVLRLREPARFDPAPLQRLVAEVGAAEAHTLVDDRLERVARILARSIRCHRQSDLALLRSLARELSALAGRLGLEALSDAAAGLSVAASAGEPVALGATLARVRRLGMATPAQLRRLRPEA